jgi:hypoxanthine-DNA glycosylase
MTVATGFPPVERADASILILGSLPGERSIAQQQYYAHPQNAFWRIMRELFDIEGDYASRCEQLVENGIALWDVLMSSHRPGSMDANISISAATPNDFPAFFEHHPSIRLIAFNGRKAEQLFGRFVAPLGIADDMRTAMLPSTSPAYASLSFPGKLQAWREALLTS